MLPALRLSKSLYYIMNIPFIMTHISEAKVVFIKTLLWPDDTGKIVSIRALSNKAILY